MAGCSEDLLARPRTEDNCSSWAPRPPRGKSPDRRQRVPGAAAPPPAAASRTLPLRRPRAERVSAGRALVTATDTQVARQARQQNGAHSQAIPLLPGGASHGTAGGWLVPPGAQQSIWEERRCFPGKQPRARLLLIPPGFRCLLARRII